MPAKIESTCMEKLAIDIEAEQLLGGGNPKVVIPVLNVEQT